MFHYIEYLLLSCWEKNGKYIYQKYIQCAFSGGIFLRKMLVEQMRFDKKRHCYKEGVSIHNDCVSGKYMHFVLFLLNFSYFNLLS